jgi:hypothetical protein
MGFKTGAFATVWETRTTNYPAVAEARISTSRKNKESGEWEQDFSQWARFCGSSVADRVLGLASGDRIRLGECEVTNRYDKSKKVTYTNYAVFDFAPADSNVKYVINKEASGYDESSKPKSSYGNRSKARAAYDGDVSDKDLYDKSMPF